MALWKMPFLLLLTVDLIFCRGAEMCNILEDPVLADNFTYFRLFVQEHTFIDLESLVEDAHIHFLDELLEPDDIYYNFAAISGLDSVEVPAEFKRP
ncbi:hypothetical protein CHS0354_006032, partial [Potamilus streckersoni]